MYIIIIIISASCQGNNSQFSLMLCFKITKMENK